MCQLSRQTKIANFDLHALTQEYVSKFQISVYNIIFMQENQPLAYLLSKIFDLNFMQTLPFLHHMA